MDLLSDPIDARIMVLVDAAIRGRLSVCAGAGLSRGHLPDGEDLARLLHEALGHRMAGYVCADDANLLQVADAADELPGGREALQRLALGLAPFDDAAPGPQHELLALLVCEGAIRLLLTNWDTCVERATEEDLRSIRDATEAAEIDRGAVLKIHGCATRPSSLLITSAQLREAPLWTRAHFAATLTMTTMVFVGIGDIAAYAQHRISELAGAIPHAQARVVSPSVEDDDKWAASAWKPLLPELPLDNRLGMTAERFADELGRGWFLQLFEAFERSRENEDELASEVAAVTAAIGQMTALDGLRWLRQSTVRPELGTSVVRGQAAPMALIAIAVLLANADGEGNAVSFLRSSAVTIGGKRVEVLLDDQTARSADVERAAAARAGRVATRLAPGVTVTVLCAIPLVVGPRRAELDDIEILDPDAPFDGLVDAPLSVKVELIYANDLMEAA